MRRFFAAVVVLCLIATGAQSYWQSRAQVSVVSAASYIGPGDIIASAKAWWGLRCYNAAYTGNVADVYAPADATHTLITCSANGVLNETLQALATTCASSCTIKTWYDQSGALNCGGAACDMVQATSGNRAALILSCLGSLYCANFISANASQYFTAVNVTAIPQPITISSVVLFSASAPSELLTDSSFNFQFSVTGTPSFRIYAGTIQDTAITLSTSHILQAVYNGASSDANIDGTRTPTAGTVGAAGLGTVSANPLSIGSAGAGTANLTGKIFEMGVWGTNFSSGNETSMCHNQFTYWGTATSC